MLCVLQLPVTFLRGRILLDNTQSEDVNSTEMNVSCCHVFLCGSVVEHCVSSAKGCGFDSQGTHILIKMYNLNVL